MTDTTQQLADTCVLVCAPDGPALLGTQDALDLIGLGSYEGAAWVAVPVGRLPENFLRLRTGIAGEIAQKFVTYRMGLAVVGDISAYVEGSTALADFVGESNRGRQLWFVPDLAALQARLGGEA